MSIEVCWGYILRLPSSAGCLFFFFFPPKPAVKSLTWLDNVAADPGPRTRLLCLFLRGM